MIIKKWTDVDYVPLHFRNLTNATNTSFLVFTIICCHAFHFSISHSVDLKKESGAFIYDGVISRENINKVSLTKYIVPPNANKALSSSFTFVEVDGKIYEYLSSYELRITRPMFNSYVRYLDTGEVYFDATTTSEYHDFDLFNFMSLLTNSFKATTNDNPYADGAIDVFMTAYHSNTITVTAIKKYKSATDTYYIYKHSYNGKTLEFSSESLGNDEINGIECIDKIYFSVKDYCEYFSIKASVCIEYKEELGQNILVVTHY